MEQEQNRGSSGKDSLKAFLEDSARPLRTRQFLLPALLLIVLLTGSNIFILSNPPEGRGLSPTFLTAALVRIAGLIAIEVGVLRMLTTSPRRPWAPDAAFALFLPAVLVGTAVSALVERLIGAGDGPAGLLAANAVTTLLLAPSPPGSWRSRRQGRSPGGRDPI